MATWSHSLAPRLESRRPPGSIATTLPRPVGNRAAGRSPHGSQPTPRNHHRHTLPRPVPGAATKNKQQQPLASTMEHQPRIGRGLAARGAQARAHTARQIGRCPARCSAPSCPTSAEATATATATATAIAPRARPLRAGGASEGQSRTARIRAPVPAYPARAVQTKAEASNQRAALRVRIGVAAFAAHASGAARAPPAAARKYLSPGRRA